MLNKYIKRNVIIVIIVMIDNLKGRMYLITYSKNYNTLIIDVFSKSSWDKRLYKNIDDNPRTVDSLVYQIYMSSNNVVLPVRSNISL